METGHQQKNSVETPTVLGGGKTRLETPWKFHCNSVSFGLRKRRKGYLQESILVLAQYSP